MVRARSSPLYVAELAIPLADAVWRSGRDRRRAVELVRGAKAGLDRLGSSGKAAGDRARSWLARHRLR